MKRISIKRHDTDKFINHMDFCIGTGRLGLGLQKNYMEQLKYVQDTIAFSHIRGHGIFHDDLSIYHEYEDKDKNICVEYNFTYLDSLFDSYLENHIVPFIELGFMPKKLASGEQAIFYWRGNVTPPKDYDKWANLVKALLVHLCDRYGKEEVLTWPIEVWNEPNLPGFWKGADEEEYFKLYDITARAVKEVDGAFRVGGPAICGVDDERWLKQFLDKCIAKDSPIDFVTRHAYAVDGHDFDGHYCYQTLRDPEIFLHELEVSRGIIDSYPKYKGMEMHITEFNTSYTPNCPLHDTNQNAAYLAKLLARMGENCASYSYWTFGDVFEEQGVPFTPFYGGFGLVANGMIPKPTYWTFYFFKQLFDETMRNESGFVLTRKGNAYRGVIYDGDAFRNKIGNDNSDHEVTTIALEVAPEDMEYTVITRTVDEETTNPLKAWHNLGEPVNPTKEQLDIIRSCSSPKVNTERIRSVGGCLEFSVKHTKNEVIDVQIIPTNPVGDRGYDFSKVM